jgi:hypothetical protein
MTKKEIAAKLGVSSFLIGNKIAEGIKRIKDNLSIDSDEQEEDFDDDVTETVIEVDRPIVSEKTTSSEKFGLRKLTPDILQKIYFDYSGNGGKLTFVGLEQKYNLCPANGMTAYRAVQKFKKNNGK